MTKRGPDGKFLPKTSDEMIEDAKEKAATATVDVDDRIADLEAQLADANEMIDALRPERNVVEFLFNTPADVIAFFGEDGVNDRVRHEIAIENKKRTQDGFDRIVYDDALFAEKRAEYINGLLQDRANSQPPRDGWLDRTLKMYKPADPKKRPGPPQLVQIPYEGQINNVAGSLADGYVRYEKKGYKRTDPMLCPSKDCWQESARDDAGEWVYHGYCSQDHFERTEKGQVDGLTV